MKTPAMRIMLASALCAATLTIGTSAWARQIFAPPPVASSYLVGRRGMEQPEKDALRGIAFRPFVPTRHYAAVALLAPFTGDDMRQNRGIGYEYAGDRGRLFALMQWPGHGKSLAGYPAIALSDPTCTDVHGFPGQARSHGIVWSTPHGIVMTLQPDGESDTRTLQAEWRRLVRRGACR